VRETEGNETAEDIQNLYTAPLFQPFVVPLWSQTALWHLPCSSLPTSCFSGYYWVQSQNGTAVQVYCDMDRVCQHWRVDLCSQSNMSDPYQQCPGEWNLQTHSSELRRLCGRGSNSAGCLSAVYNTYGKIIVRQRCAIPIRSNCSFCVHKQTTTPYYWQAEQLLLPCCACMPTNVSFSAVLSRAMHTLSGGTGKKALSITSECTQKSLAGSELILASYTVI